MIQFFTTIIKHILLLITIPSIIISLESKLNIISPDNNPYFNFMYFVGGLCLGFQIYWRLMFPKVDVTVTLEQEKIEK